MVSHIRGLDHAGPLDLRFDQTAGQSAWEYLQTCDRGELAKILLEFGDGTVSQHGLPAAISQLPSCRLTAAAILQLQAYSCNACV